MFSNIKDKKQFESIWKCINDSLLIQNMNIYLNITKCIAQYATGLIEQCSNQNCRKDIHILHNEIQYAENDNTSAEVGFKFVYYDQYYCRECMDDVGCCACGCGCEQEAYRPNCRKCSGCQELIYHSVGSNTDNCCQCSVQKCNHDACNVILCGNCNQSKFWKLKECVECTKLFCRNMRFPMKCIKLIQEWNNFGICYKCYRGKVECDKCECYSPLVCLSQKALNMLEDDQYPHLKCIEKKCNEFICYNCDESQRNGKYILKTWCFRIGPYCKTHLPKDIKDAKDPWAEFK
eukprot:434809_1